VTREPLALKYRPRRFIDLVGQTANAGLLYQMARRGTVPNALLFEGFRGCGKTSSARILASALNCLENDQLSSNKWPCGFCTSCRAVAAGNSLDVIEVDAASNGNVERIREIRDMVQYGTAGEYRVVLLDEAHSMSRDANNALLKVLEEPPDRTVFVLLTTESAKLLPTIISRCTPFVFRKISSQAIKSRLVYICQQEQFEAEEALLTAIAESSSGGMRDAVVKLDQVASVGVTTLDAWRQLTGETDFAPRFLAAAASGTDEEMFAVLDTILGSTGDYAWVTSQIVQCLVDILILSRNAPISAQGAALAARQDLARAIPRARVVAAMSVLWDLQVRVRAEDRHAGLSLAAVMVSERLRPQAQTPPHTNGNGHARMSAGDVRHMMGVPG
jgi:DNA polymerase III subunit gamma/tau